MFVDDVQGRAYDWENQIRYRNIRNPEWHGYFTLVVDMIENYGYATDESGMMRSVAPGSGSGSGSTDRKLGASWALDSKRDAREPYSFWKAKDAMGLE